MRKSKLKIYIINLKRHTIRRKRIEAELKSVGFFNYEFIDAVDGTDIPTTESLIEDGTLNPIWIGPNGKLTSSIIACALSHQKAYKKMLKDGHESALILEDDAEFTKYGIKMILTGNVGHYLNPLNRSIDWDVFVWGGASDDLYYRNIGIPGIGEYKRYLPYWAASSYQITKRGAEKLIESNTPLRYAADVNLECADTKMYCLDHSLMVQTYGDWERPFAEKLHADATTYLAGITEYNPSTGMVRDGLNNLEEAKNTQNPTLHYFSNHKKCEVTGDIDVNLIEWKDHTNDRGDTLKYWTHIHLNH